MGPSCITEDGSNKGSTRKVGSDGDDTKQYKSKNLEAERKRRQKLSDRLLTLRSLVPHITNMNKATIIEDAINYIEELQNSVKSLSDMLVHMEASSSTSSPRGRETKPGIRDEMNADEDVKQHGIQEEVQVRSINENKMWMKIILEKRKGRFTKLVEGMTFLGFELTDISVTAIKGAILISSCVEVADGEMVTVEQTTDMLLEIMRSM